MNFKQTVLFVIAVVIVIAILTLVPQFDPEIKVSNEEKALSSIRIINDVLERIKEDIDAYPSSEVGLNVVYSNIGKDGKWDGPYLLRELNTKDPWGNDLIYRYPHQCSVRKGTFALYSVGSNGIDECMSGDDIALEP